LKKGSPNDFQTPPEAIKPLLPYLPKKWTIWESASGKGNLVKAFKKEGYKVIASDIIKGQDFLKVFPNMKFDCIITNPPYSLKQQFLERAYKLNKPFAFLLPLTALETAKRQRLFERNGLEVILFDRRISFETPNNNGTSSWFATAWFTHGLHIGRQLTFTTYPLYGFSNGNDEYGLRIQ
jgi:hypothetical protein